MMDTPIRHQSQSSTLSGPSAVHADCNPQTPANTFAHSPMYAHTLAEVIDQLQPASDMQRNLSMHDEALELNTAAWVTTEITASGCCQADLNTNPTISGDSQ